MANFSLNSSKTISGFKGKPGKGFWFVGFMPCLLLLGTKAVFLAIWRKEGKKGKLQWGKPREVSTPLTR